MTDYVATLEVRKPAIDQLLAAGARLELIISFLGDGAYGDTLPVLLVRRIADLGVDLAVEVFAVPQTEWGP